MSPRPKEYVTDPEIAERVLEEMDPEVARIAVKKSISKGAIYDACKQIYGANGVSRGSAICARIRREGGIEKVSGDPALEVGEGAE